MHQKGCVIPILNYTLSHPENDRDVTDRVQENMLQDAFFTRQSLCSFLNTEKTLVLEVRQSIERILAITIQDFYEVFCKGYNSQNR